ncbi:alkaline phosphatase [Streptoalloteichus hindustanus]|uniref:Alkaline phosphatase n=1 Tax=Streptoalloteichus hindustanus TaxID=2017 RepID=Q2MEW5_STRHI|nr:alkaline phosphatase [Streptoalloteichus hindustanus]CAI47659.1 putative 6-phosphate phosphatase [Streptoalloteichus hindustanus]SHG38790.1 alkaline phosphatase [Streptoalloteichus hindustanus]
MSPHPQKRRSRTSALLAVAALAAALSPTIPAVADDTAEGFALAPNADRTHHVRSAVRGGKARNVLLFVGDGMGDSEITLARNYELGAAGRLNLDRLPLTGAYTTYSVAKGDPGRVEYVTDSAAAATGYAIGAKTYNGAVGVDAHGRERPTILELAKRRGYRTGNVTTAELQDATPAALSAHVLDRTCRGPQDMKECAPNDKRNGGAGSIAEQQVALRADVLMGGGGKYFDQQVAAGQFAGRTVRQQAVDSGFQVITSADQMRALDRERPVLGVFAAEGLDSTWTGPPAKAGGTPPSRCAENPARRKDQPTLADMTRASIDLLERRSRGHDRGFFLQVEGAQIDWGAHDGLPCEQIGETVQFDRAVAVGMEFARRRPDTLVIVTADHAQTTQIIPNGQKSPGMTATLITNEGGHMTVNYATGLPGELQEHTGTQVRIAGYGPQAANVVGVTDQTDLFRTLSRAMGVR